jgi:Mrp family chromosome partitioning ATPase
MEQLEELADVVVYDSPPAATVTDAAVLSTRVDSVLHVVKARGSRRDLVLRVKNSLERVGARVLGPVLNQVGPSDLGYYSYYYYGYHQDNDEPQKRRGFQQRLRRRKEEAEDHKAERPSQPEEHAAIGSGG